MKKNLFNLISGLWLLAIAAVNSGCNKDKDNGSPSTTPAFKVFRTSDGGATWGDAQTITGSNTPIKVTFSEPNTWFILASPSLFRSTDGGNTWQKINTPVTGDKIGSISSGGRNSFCALALKSGEIYTSDDNGDSWTKSITPPTLSYELKSIHVTAEPFSYGFATGKSGTILGTIDTGNTWVQIPFPNTNTIYDLDYSGGGQSLLAASDDKKVYVSNDFGQNWTGVSIPGNNSSILNVTVAENGLEALCIDGSGYVFYSSNLGLTWESTQIPPSSPHKAILATAYTVNALFGVGEGGAVWKSTDNGKTWSNIPTQITNTLVDISFKDDLNGIIIAK